MNKGLGRKTWFAIVLFSLFGQVAWTIENMFFNVFIEETFGAGGNDISLMVSASALAATITTLFMGALSDKLGKRKVFICFGYLLWGLSIMAFALLRIDTINAIFGEMVNAAALGIGLTIAFDCLMTFFGSTANDAAFSAWMTDITDSSNRGKVEGINSAMPLISILVVFGADMLIPKGDSHWTILFLIFGIVVLIVGILSFFLIDEPEVKVAKDTSYFKNIFHGFRINVIKENKWLYIFLLGLCVFSISVQVFMPFLILYFTKTLLLENYVLIFAPAIVVAAVFTMFYGKYIDKYGFKIMSPISLVIYIVGLLILGVFTNQVLVFIGTLLMMMGFLSITACFNASIRDNTPADKVGLFQGIRIFMSVLIPMLIGPWIGSAISGEAGMLGVVGEGFTPSALIFIAALLVGLLTFVFIGLVYKKKGDSNVKLQSDDAMGENI